EVIDGEAGNLCKRLDQDFCVEVLVDILPHTPQCPRREPAAVRWVARRLGGAATILEGSLGLESGPVSAHHTAYGSEQLVFSAVDRNAAMYAGVHGCTNLGLALLGGHHQNFGWPRTGRGRTGGYQHRRFRTAATAADNDVGVAAMREARP